MAITRPLTQTFLRVLFEPAIRVITEVAPGLERELEGRGFKLIEIPPNLQMLFAWGELVENVPVRYVGLGINTAQYAEMGSIYKGFNDFYPGAEEILRLVLERAFGDRMPLKKMTVGYVDLFGGETLRHLTPELAGIKFDLTQKETLVSFHGVSPNGDSKITITITKLPNTPDPTYMGQWFYESGLASWEDLRGKAFIGHDALREIFQRNISGEMKEVLYGMGK